MTKKDLFIKLAKPNKKGISKWVETSKFKGKYACLSLGNGAHWCRKEASLNKNYNVEFDRSVTPGTKIDKIRLNGFSNINSSQQISTKIKKDIKDKTCVILGTSNPEVDHKNGRKNDSRVMTTTTQTLDDFQPLSKAANDAKRQFCKACEREGKRFDAKELGYPISFYEGDENHDNSINGCIGCFWFDPIEFRKHLNEFDDSEQDE